VFLLFVALSVFAQTLTGFAQALICLGLVGATNLVPLPDAVNATAVLGFMGSFTFLRMHWPVRFLPELLPTVITSVCGVVAGTLLLTWLAGGGAYELLRVLLGLSIAACALVLWKAREPLPALSSKTAFAAAGAVSGLMAGMFSAPGPPLVYLLYRQPLPHKRIRESLMLMFGMGTLLRLGIVVPTGHFSWLSLHLSLEAIPVVLLVTSLTVKYPPAFSPRLFKAFVCVLLLVSGVGMLGSAAVALLK
ncbi:MAG TPA: hypothetical protein VGN52_16870, partial [Burkholderiales bacterium]